MTIPWRTLEEALKCAVQSTSGVRDVRWKWEPSAMRQPLRIDLKRTPVTPIGVDERRHTRDSKADRLSATQVGQRSFSLELRCLSDRGSPSNDENPQDAADVLAQVMTRIRRPSIQDELARAGCSLSTVGPVTRSEYTVKEREYGLAILTLGFLVADVDADDTEATIEKVNGTVAVSGPDDSEFVVPFSAEEPT